MKNPSCVSVWALGETGLVKQGDRLTFGRDKMRIELGRLGWQFKACAPSKASRQTCQDTCQDGQCPWAQAARVVSVVRDLT